MVADLCLRALRVWETGGGVAGGALQESQSYMHMPTPGSTAEKLSHLHSVCSIHVVFTLSFSHDVGSLSHLRLVATGNTGMHHPTGTGDGMGELGPHHVQHLSAEQSA